MREMVWLSKMVVRRARWRANRRRMRRGDLMSDRLSFLRLRSSGVGLGYGGRLDMDIVFWAALAI